MLQSSRPTCNIYYYPWERGKSTGSIALPDTQVNQVIFNPFNSQQFSAVGKEYFTVFNYKDNSITASPVSLPAGEYRCHLWLSKERMLVGTAEGKLLLLISEKIVNITDF